MPQIVPAPIRIVDTVFPSSKGKAMLEGRKFDIVTSIAMFYDLESPIEFAQDIKEILAEKGVWVLEMSYLPLMLKMNSFDTICHEHLEYYSYAVLDYIAKAANLRIFKAELNAINGGSIRCYLTHDNCIDYDSRAASDYIRRLQVMEFEMQLDEDAPYRAFQGRFPWSKPHKGGLSCHRH